MFSFSCAEAIYKVCQDHMVNLAETIKNIIDDYLTWGDVMDGRDVSQSDAPSSCPGKLQLQKKKKKEALDAMRSIKERVRALKKRLTALGSDEPTGETLALEKELAHLKVEWDKWEQKRQKAAKERMILLGHEKE